MQFDDILRADPTESTHTSRLLLLDILLHKPQWRCYTTQTHSETDTLIARFLRSHARIPGMITPESQASEPAAIFYWKDTEGVHYKGATFLNGAVFYARHPGGREVRTLFVADETAQMWGGYPPLTRPEPAPGDEDADG